MLKNNSIIKLYLFVSSKIEKLLTFFHFLTSCSFFVALLLFCIIILTQNKIDVINLRKWILLNYQSLNTEKIRKEIIRLKYSFKQEITKLIIII